MLGGYFGNCELIAYGFKAALHNGEGRDSHRAGAALGRAAWGRSPLSAMGTPWGDGICGWGQPPLSHPAAFGVSFPNKAKVGSAWKKELHLQWAVDVPSQGGHTGLSISEVIGFIFILELGCIFFIVACHNFSEMHTHPGALGSNKKLNKSTYYWWWIKTISGRVISSHGACVEEDSVILWGIF